MVTQNLNKIIQEDAQKYYKRQIDETNRLVKKWSRTGLLEGLDQEYEKHGMAILLENQARELVKEFSSTGGQNTEEWSGVALPLVRRIFSQIAAKEFVSLQPMNLPSGLVFYVDFKYGTDQPGFETTAGTSLQDNTIHGVTNSSSEPSEGLYGAGRFAYSSNDYTITGSAVSGSISTATEADVSYNSDLTASISGSLLSKLTFDMTGTSHDTKGVRAFEITATELDAYYPAYTLPTDESGATSTSKVSFIVKPNTTLTNSTVFTIRYQKQPIDYTRGDFEASGEYNSTSAYDADAVLDIPEINVGLRSVAIVAKTKKLKAIWTPEFAQDLNAYHSIDAELELTSMLSEYVSMEIDLEILDMLIQDALTTEKWSAKVGTIYDSVSSTWKLQDAQQGRALSYTQNEWFKTLGTKIQRVSNQIHAKTMRGGANFLVVGPNAATILESIPGYSTDTDGNRQQFAMGVEKVGMLNQRFQVYKNPYMKEHIVLLGFRGSQFLETGAVYAPYIPLIMTPTVLDPANFTPRKGVMTRYSKKMLRPEFYGKVLIADMNYV